MKKNLLKSLLIALSMVFGVSAADAQTEIFKWDNANKASDYVAEVGTIECLAGTENGARLNYKNTALGVDYMTICLNGKQADLGKTDNSSGTYMKVTPTKALKAGDIISVTAFRNKDDKGKKASAIFLLDNSKSFVLGAAPEFPNLNEKGENPTGTPGTLTHVVTEEEAGATSFNMTRKDASTNLFITSLVITTEEEKAIDGTATSFKEPLALQVDKTYLIDINEGNEGGMQFYTFQSAYDCQVYLTPDVFAHFIVTKGNFPFDENYNDQEDAVDEKTFKMVGGFGPLDEFDDPFGDPEPQNPTYNWTAKAGVKYYVMADFVMDAGTFTVTAGDPVIPAQGTIVENPINLNSRPSVTWDSEKNVADGSTYYTYTAPRDGVLTITMNGWVSEEVNVGEDGFYDPWDRDLAGGPQYSGEIENEYLDNWSGVKYTFAVEEGVTYCIVIPDLYSAYGDITVSAKFTIPGVYGQLIEEMDAVAERVAELNEMYDADKRAQLRLTEMWARIMDQIYYEQRMLEHDMINVEKPTNLQLALHKTRIATIYVALNSFETAAQLHANKEQIMKGIYEALLNLISSRDIMAKQYAIPADDAQWNSICARIAAQERTVDALYDAVEDPTAEQISACEVEMSSIEAAMEAFAAKMESEATAIQSATATANDANIYNVAGQKSSANYRGIVIKNGKKMMVK